MASLPRYRVHRLRARETFEAFDVTHITNSGLVFGHYTDATGHDLGIAVWRVGGSDWPAAEQLIPVSELAVRGVNDAGQFVGALNENSVQPRAVFGALSPNNLPEAAMRKKHRVLEGRAVCWSGGSFALGVNNRGAVIGGFVRKQRASGFVWSHENGFVDLEAPPDAEQKEEGGWLTGCVPLSINDFGAILGWRVNGKTALQWNLRGKLVAELEGDFVALKKITNAGHVLWWTKLPGFVSSSRVSRDGVEEVLPLVEGACGAEACDINNLGEIIGEARVPTRLTERLPCLWTSEGEAHNLNTLISEREVIVDRPRAINDAGWIACQGAYRGRYGVPFVLEPGE